MRKLLTLAIIGVLVLSIGIVGCTKKAASSQEAIAQAKELKSVEEHLAAAAEHHKMLHKECCKDAVHGDVCMKHCNEILLELDMAQAKQDALIRSLEIGAGSTSSASGTHQHP